MHPLVEGVIRAGAEIGSKAIRRAVDSVMEDGQRAAEEIQRDIMDARSRIDGDTIDVPFEVRQVNPEDDMGRGERRRREPREPREEQPNDDPPPSGDIADIAELTDMRDAETFIRHGWMLFAELADSGALSKDTAKDLESILTELREQIEDREGVE